MIPVLLTLMTLGWSQNCLSIRSTFEEQQHRRCAFTTERGSRSVHVLVQKGKQRANARFHTEALFTELQSGPIVRVMEKFQEITARSSLSRGLIQCQRRRLESRLSARFQDLIEGSAEGLALEARRRGLSQTPYSVDQVRLALMAVDLQIVMEGLAQRFRDNPPVVLTEIMTTCGLRMSLGQLGQILESLLGPLQNLKAGCLGFSVPAGDSVVGHMHGRNFDSDYNGTWPDHPVVSLVTEPGKYKYVAVAAAGVTYPGGISGFNEKGISVSSHQMSSTDYRTSFSSHQAEVGPYIQQRILSEAASIDAAAQIVAKTGRIGAWTILISDSKTGESAALEFTGQAWQLVGRTRGALGQSNHFTGDQMLGRDRPFSAAKLLESVSRRRAIDQNLANGQQKHLPWALDQLASHWDGLSQSQSTVGRTAVKTYNVMSTVALPDRRQLWISLGERLPAAHSTFAGFEVDWQRMDIHSVGVLRTQAYRDQPEFEGAIESLVRAKEAYGRGHHADALTQLERAETLARHSGVESFAPSYLRARLLGLSGRSVEAVQAVDQALAAPDATHDRWVRGRLFRINEMDLWPRRSAELAAYMNFRSTELERIRTEVLRLRSEFRHPEWDEMLRQIEDRVAGLKFRNSNHVDFVTIE